MPANCTPLHKQHIRNNKNSAHLLECWTKRKSTTCPRTCTHPTLNKCTKPQADSTSKHRPRSKVQRWQDLSAKQLGELDQLELTPKQPTAMSTVMFSHVGWKQMPASLFSGRCFAKRFDHWRADLFFKTACSLANIKRSQQAWFLVGCVRV